MSRGGGWVVAASLLAAGFLSAGLLASGPVAAEPPPPSTDLLPALTHVDPSPRDAPPFALRGRLYGFWGLNGYLTPAGLEDVARRFGLTVFHTATTEPRWSVHTLLPMARAAGARVTLRLTGDHDAYTTNGDFDLARWKERLALWQGSGLQAYIDDGTLVGHMLLDDIENFDGHDPDAAELDEMARYSKELMPGLMTFVRQKASALPNPPSGRYRWVDATVNQYRAVEGDVEVYALREAAAATALGLGIINGLNIANGGDGSSGQPGWNERGYAMSASEIARYGAVLGTVPGCGMFLNWEYDGEERWTDGSVGSDWFDRADVQAALADLGALVARQPNVTLLRASE